jgi:hypothetical protein
MDQNSSKGGRPAKELENNRKGRVFQEMLWGHGEVANAGRTQNGMARMAWRMEGEEIVWRRK